MKQWVLTWPHEQKKILCKISPSSHFLPFLPIFPSLSFLLLLFPSSLIPPSYPPSSSSSFFPFPSFLPSLLLPLLQSLLHPLSSPCPHSCIYFFFPTPLRFLPPHFSFPLSLPSLSPSSLLPPLLPPSFLSPPSFPPSLSLCRVMMFSQMTQSSLRTIPYPTLSSICVNPLRRKYTR